MQNYYVHRIHTLLLRTHRHICICVYMYVCIQIYIYKNIYIKSSRLWGLHIQDPSLLALSACQTPSVIGAWSKRQTKS